ncbi:MAG TPA: glycine--tRNA ligase [Nitrososphaeraceae archaeon]|nr:glycine--tRNA ligase [Nitrososphaeraceae archaeon]
MSNYDRIMKLALEKGFYFPSCEIYADAPAGFWEYGPTGLKIKNKLTDLWRREIIRRDGMLEIDGSQIMSKSVFEASGHFSNFTDPIIKCAECGSTFRVDKLISEIAGKDIPEKTPNEELDAIIVTNGIRCPTCNGRLGKTARFNMMFRLEIGPSAEEAYLRPETCQTIFVDFPRVYKTMRGKLPIGIAQLGKSFRNEIAPRQSLLRLREFYQAEVEIFCNPAKLDDISNFDEVSNTPLRISLEGTSVEEVTAKESVKRGLLPNKLVAYYLSVLADFYDKTGIDMQRTRFRQLHDNEKAFYASVAFDFEVETSIGWLELVACNYRSDHDLKGHSIVSKQNLEVIDPSDQSKILPHVFELSMGIDRSIYAILEHSYFEDPEHDNRAVLKLKPYLAPILVGILPLVNRDGLPEKSQMIHSELKREFDSYYDDSGSIGRRYRRLEQIGVPFAITVDKTTLQDNSVTIRQRDTMKQERVMISSLKDYLHKSLQC